MTSCACWGQGRRCRHGTRPGLRTLGYFARVSLWDPAIEWNGEARLRAIKSPRKTDLCECFQPRDGTIRETENLKVGLTRVLAEAACVRAGGRAAGLTQRSAAPYGSEKCVNSEKAPSVAGGPQ